MRRILVAGATGYLGRHVVREFKEQGHFVRILARRPEKLVEIQKWADETCIGDVTKPSTLQSVCNGIDIVFSSVGVTKPTPGGGTVHEVDFQGNKNLLSLAQASGVSKFLYIATFNGPQLLHLGLVRAHEEFVGELTKSGMNHTILRPTGFFSDMGEFLKMARKGRAFLFGTGE